MTIITSTSGSSFVAPITTESSAYLLIEEEISEVDFASFELVMETIEVAVF